MNLQDIRDLYDYNDWANRLLLDQAGRLSREQLNAATPAFCTIWRCYSLSG